jgi:hypothetical protein
MVSQRLGNGHERNAEILCNVFHPNSHIQSIPRFENEKKSRRRHLKESILSIKPGPFDTSVENQGLLAKRKDFCLEFQSRLDRKNRKIVE